MAAETADTNATDSIKVDTMTQATGILDIAGSIMERIVRPSPVVWVCVVDSMATLATTARGTVDADIEAWIGARSAVLSMTLLAVGQVGLGIRAMIGSQQVGPIDWMWCPLGSIGMTVKSFKGCREATGRRLVTGQVRAMTGLTGLRPVQRCIWAVVNKGV